MPRPYYTLLVIAFACSCAKNISTGNNTTGNNSTGNGDSSAAVTAIGTPNGSPVTKTIGAAGGTIISTDGRAELNIPAGALSSDLAITIQPVTNECPNGVGVAYDFLPNGTKFLTPATLTIHYTDDDVNGTDPYLLNTAFQDSLNEWEVDIYKDVDTTAKTIIFDVSHFTIRAVQAMVKVNPKLSSLSGTDFTENQQGVLVVSQGVTPAQLAGGSDPDLAFTLPRPSPVSDALVSNWSVSGGNQNGSLSSTSGSTITYTAPNTILETKTVTVSVKVAINAVSMSRSKLKTRVSTSFVTLSIRLHLHPNDLSFSIKVIFNVPDVSSYHQAYHDEATFEVDVKNYLVTIPSGKIQNQQPTVTPSTNVVGTDSSVWKPEPYGEINISGGTGYVILDSVDFNKRDVVILINNTNTTGPSFDVINTISNNNSPIVGLPTPGYPTDFGFIYKDSVQVLDPQKGNILEGMQTITITPIH